MGLKCGIVGLPNVGKSTLFNALTNAKALAANYPFATKDPNLGVITVPDGRLNKLAELVKPQRILPTTVDIVDIAGLIKGASKGEGLGNQFLANIREVDAILHVVRCFDDDNVVHVDGSIDPVRDKEIIDLELIFKDIETVEKRIEKLKKNAKSGNKEELKKLDIAKALLCHLEEEKPARSFLVEEELVDTMLRDMQLLTAKPVMYVCNVDDDSVLDGNAYTQRIAQAVANENAQLVIVAAGIEADLVELDSDADKLEFLKDMGLEEPGVYQVIQAAYRLLDLITYFTAGEKEVRAWTVRKGAKAPEAAGVIHTDFEKGFIRAEVISYEDYVRYGSESAARDAGKLRIEGKEYEVVDGDVMHFLFNV